MPSIVGPAGLNRQSRQIDVTGLDHDLLARGAANGLRRHIQDLLVYGQRTPGVLHATRGVRLLQVSEQPAHLAQRADGLLAHAERNSKWRAEKVGEHRHLVADRVLEQQRRPGAAQRPITNLGDFEPWIDWCRHALELATCFQHCDELSEISIFHGARAQMENSANTGV
jgi:hypothetical protein